mmetsp:Transcript_15861/g.47739  ORF Transcript_15861/g.47739 Transcript_15861/m.47739 type:complete len:320 (-) Transcript_15861:325-1284(-)
MFGQLVVGPPGSGKTTYCNGMQQFLGLLGRKVAVVNLDPANDRLPYECAVDVRGLVSLEDVQDSEGLGPNGGLFFCMEYIESNLDWLQERLAPLLAEGRYLLIDCPGQVELFTLHGALPRVLKVLTDSWHLRLAAVHLVDAHLAADPGKFLAAALLSLSVMMHLELPHINVLSKVDLVAQYGRPEMGLEFYLQADDLAAQLPGLMDRRGPDGAAFPPRYRRLTAALCEVVDDYGMLQFLPLHIEDKHSVRALLRHVDKANGYAFTGRPDTEGGFPSDLTAVGTADYGERDLAAEFEERYMGDVTDRHEQRAAGEQLLAK